MEYSSEFIKTDGEDDLKCRLYLVDVGLDVVIAEHDVMNSEQGVQLTGLLPIEHILVHLYSVQQL